MINKLVKKTLIATAVATTMVAGSVQAEGHSEEITVVSWGGAYTVSQVEAYHKPWMAATGNTIVSDDYNGGLAEIKAQVMAENVTWNLVDVELSDAVRGCDEGILEVMDHSVLPDGDNGVPAAEDFLPGALVECAVGNIVWSTVFIHDESKIQGVDGLTDFFDLNKFPGKRGMRKGAKPNLEFALMADGVEPADVYEMLSTDAGVDRAFAKLDTIKDSMVWWESGAQPPQLLADGEVTMTTAYNGRVFNAIASEGKPFVINWDGQVWDLDLWVIPKGASNQEATMDFVKFSTGTKPLADQASWIPYGPLRKSSFGLVGSFHDKPELDMAPHMPTAPDNFKRALQNDFEFWADNSDQLNERFNAWLTK